MLFLLNSKVRGMAAYAAIKYVIDKHIYDY